MPNLPNDRQAVSIFPLRRGKNTRVNIQILAYFFLLPSLLFLSNALADDAQLTSSSPLPGITTITSQHAPLLLRQSVTSVRVYAFHGDRLEPIPFQIDERDHHDRWVLDHGQQAKPDDTPGVIDDNDVLVLMNHDLGQQGDSARLPQEAAMWAEVRIGSDPTPIGFAYIGIFTTGPEVSARSSYTHYDPQSDFVFTESYTLGFAGAPLPSYLAFVGRFIGIDTNLIAGVRVIGEVRFLRGLLTLRRTDQDIHTEVLGYRQGPVRTIRRARYWIPLPLGFRTNGRIDIAFYRDVVEGTTIVKLKVPPRLILADGELQAYFRFLDLTGARLLTEGDVGLSVVDGHMDAEERMLHQRPTRWAALTLPNGRALLLIARLEGTLQKLEQRLYFDDSAPTHTTRGTKPHFGFEFSRVNQLETGTHHLSVFAITLDSTRSEDIHRTAERFLLPPEVSVTPLPPRETPSPDAK